MKVGDLVILKALSIFYVDGDYDFREVVKEKLKEEMGIGIIAKINEKKNMMYVYWSKEKPTWEYKKDLEILNESW